MKRYITLFILLVFVVSCCCVSAFASTKNVSVYLQSYSNGDVYGNAVVLEGDTGVVSSTQPITIGGNRAIFLSTFNMGYEDGSIFLWGNRSYDIVLENVSFNVSFPLDNSNFDYHFAERLTRDRIELRVTYVDGSTEIIQGLTYLDDLTSATNKINDVVYDISSGTHTIYLSLSPTKDIRRVSVWEYMYLMADLESDGFTAGTYNVPGVAGFETPLKLSVTEKEAYNQTLENINQNQQETNDKLDDVISGQESIQDRIDELMNGNVGVTKPSGSGIIQDIMQSEQDLLDDNASNIHAGQALQQNALEVLANYQNAFIVFALLFNMLYQIPFFQSLVIISLAIGIVSLMFNLGLHASTRYPAKEAETKEEYVDAISADMATWRR